VGEREPGRGIDPRVRPKRRPVRTVVDVEEDRVEIPLAREDVGHVRDLDRGARVLEHPRRHEIRELAAEERLEGDHLLGDHDPRCGPDRIEHSAERRPEPEPPDDDPRGPRRNERPEGQLRFERRRGEENDVAEDEIHPGPAATNDELRWAGAGHGVLLASAGGTCHPSDRPGRIAIARNEGGTRVRAPARRMEDEVAMRTRSFGDHARPLLLSLALLLTLLSIARPASAQTSPLPPTGDPSQQVEDQWLGARQAQLEERFADGDLDEEDLVRIQTPRAGIAGGLGMGRERSGGRDLLAQSWVSLVGFSSQLPTGLHEVGGFVVVGVAFDKIAQGDTYVGIRPGPARGAGIAQDASPRPAPTPSPRVRLAIDAPLARGAVRSAWRASGIEVNDARIDQMISRSRLSVLLPETRLRAMQVFQDGEHTTEYINESGTIVDTSGSTTTLEARLTWRLDRLIFSGDEPTLERVRLEREETRNRIASKILELLFTWQRALLDEAASDSGSRAEVDATLRELEAEISLDVLTGGWFGAQPAVRARAASAGANANANANAASARAAK